MIAHNTRSRKSIPLRQRSGPARNNRNVATSDVTNLKRVVRGFYKKHGRHNLPWRKTKNPYRILVSEVMLQQTQVERVVPYYKAFLKRFPSVGALAEAPLPDVLRVWQGLGYNRRAKSLHDAAKNITTIYRSNIPREYEKLVALPGVGDYTAKAVRVFAYNEPEIMVETNIRTVFIHHFFPDKKSVSDKALLPYMVASLDTNNPRAWYAALMDYGTHLKKTIPNPSRKSKHHVRQKPFKGSDREIRGALLRAVLDGSEIAKIPFDKKRIAVQLKALKKEGLVQ